MGAGWCCRTSPSRPPLSGGLPWRPWSLCWTWRGRWSRACWSCRPRPWPRQTSTWSPSCRKLPEQSYPLCQADRRPGHQDQEGGRRPGHPHGGQRHRQDVTYTANKDVVRIVRNGDVMKNFITGEDTTATTTSNFQNLDLDCVVA